MQNSIGSIFPADVCKGYFRITMIGSAELWIENSLKLLSYTDSLIVVSGRQNNLYVEGKGLYIRVFTCDEMKIEGCVCKLYFQ